MNSTLQGSEAVAFSIAAHLEIPNGVADTEEALVAYIKQMLSVASGIVKGLSFEVEIGPARGLIDDADPGPADLTEFEQGIENLLDDKRPWQADQ